MNPDEILKKVLEDEGTWWINSKEIGKGNYKDFTHRLLTDKVEFEESIKEAIRLTAEEKDKEIAELKELLQLQQNGIEERDKEIEEFEKLEISFNAVKIQNNERGKILADLREKIIGLLDDTFNQGFEDKMNRFILYPKEWEDYKVKLNRIFDEAQEKGK